MSFSFVPGKQWFLWQQYEPRELLIPFNGGGRSSSGVKNFLRDSGDWLVVFVVLYFSFPSFEILEIKTHHCEVVQEHTPLY